MQTKPSKALSIVCCFSLLGFCAGCVSLSRYEKLKKERDALEKSRQALQDKLQGHARMITRAQEQNQALELSRSWNAKEAGAYKKLLDHLKASLGAGKFQLKLAGRRMVLVLASDILFESGSAVISKRGNKALGQIAATLAEHPFYRYQIEGHTDNVPIHTPLFPSNWELAATRSLNVLHTMVAAGMNPSQLSSASFAATRPVKSNAIEEGRAANRRIEIAIIPDLSVLSQEEHRNKAGSKND